jgi:hypothetical protein
LDFFDAQVAQTRDLLLELLAHLSEVLRDLCPRFKDCRVDDLLEELGTHMQTYLKNSHRVRA